MKIKILTAATELSTDEWATLTGDTPAQMRDPFCSRVFLSAAESSMCNGDSPVGADNTASISSLGWQAHHICLTDDYNRVAALLPLYLRTLSFGDFSRDWGWPEAWQRAGFAYYPKLVSGMPFTPSPGPRFLVRPDLPRAIWVAALIQAAIAEVARLEVSNWQCLFVNEEDAATLSSAGLLMRRGVQFHWRNADYKGFDDFLAGFTAEKRKKLKRERRAVTESGVQLETLHGDEISKEMWRDIHRQYRDTFARYGNYPAFPLTFFIEVGAKLGRQLVVFVARENDHIIASAICYRDGNALYGRHWGCDRTIPGLHFELCLYQGIEYCIAQGLQSFEPGAQGEHKLARGFTPVATWSGFWIADPRLRRAVGDFVSREDATMQDYAAEASAHLPFRRGA
ncbi:MAG: GNAT family N-acetyltransferase [Rhodocyclaceae bacterium]|nr:GNAT family N-acetyltransferase [Rhodocyclaceae bacterium]